MQVLIRNGMVVTMNPGMTVYGKGDVLVENDRIKAVGQVDLNDVDANAEIIDARGKLVLPGLINTHVHTSQQLGRGLGDDVPLLVWLAERTFPYESQLTEEDSYISTLLCCLEQVKCGVTTFAEPGGQHVNGMGRAVSEIGIRGILARSSMDCGEGLPPVWQETTEEVLDIQVDNLKKWHNSANGRIKVWFGLRTIFNNSDELIVKTKELADQYGVGVHMHVAEIREEISFCQETRGAGTVTHLHNLGVLDKNFLAVHCVWLTDEELDLFAQHEVKVSHNPAAAMRVLGFAKIPEMLDKGICVTIGTDGAPSNNRMDLIDEMWLTSLIHKGRLLDPTAVPAQQIVKMVTVDGAKALLWESEIGSLEVGKKADLIVIDPDSPGMLPLHDPIANLVTSMHSSNVRSVMCDGRWVMKDRKVLTVDEKAILEEAKARAKAIRKRAGIELPERFPMVD
ncbi:MAG: amidohydrolase [Clostridia bacterium]|nr:amidohydrolase [Clostridia bacterium]